MHLLLLDIPAGLLPFELSFCDGLGHRRWSTTPAIFPKMKSDQNIYLAHFKSLNSDLRNLVCSLQLVLNFSVKEEAVFCGHALISWEENISGKRSTEIYNLIWTPCIEFNECNTTVKQVDLSIGLDGWMDCFFYFPDNDEMAGDRYWRPAQL